MPKNAIAKSKAKEEKQTAKQETTSVWDIFKFGESYTSLILGIIVVIVATITLITFVKGKDNLARLTEDKQTVASAQVTVTNTPTPKITQNVLKGGTVAPKPTIAKKQLVKENTQITTKPTIAVKSTPATVAKATITVKPTAKPTAKPSIVAKKTETKKTFSGKDTYVVVKGDSLWSIAENKYKSGYNWVDIQKANNITNADVLYTGTKLTLPDVKAKVATKVENQKIEQETKTTVQSNKISAGDYTIAKGDTLWGIAERAYGDGHEWAKIAQANNLSNPRLIHSGNKLIIPQG